MGRVRGRGEKLRREESASLEVCGRTFFDLKSKESSVRLEGDMILKLFEVENAAVLTDDAAVSRGKKGQLCVLSSCIVAGLAVIQ